MNKRQGKSAAFIREALKRSLIPRNQVATFSGLTNTYIRDLEQGNIANASREKLIALAITINLTLHETDELLTVFDRAKLNMDDVSIYIQSVKQRGTSTVVHPVRDYFGYELLLLGAEQTPGAKVVSANHPTAILRVEGHRTSVEIDMVEDHPIYWELREAIGRERRRNLGLQLNHYAMDHYIHKKSLEEYIRGCHDPKEREWRKKHIESVLLHIRNYENFNYYLTKIQSTFNFMIKFTGSSDEAEKVFFYAHSSPVLPGQMEGQVIGFLTENQTIVEQFKKDVEILREHVLDEYLNCHKLESFFEVLISQ